MKRKLPFIPIILFFLIIHFPNQGLCQNPTQPKKVLKVSHIGPDTWILREKILTPWSQKIERLSNGELQFKIFSFGELSGNQEKINLLLAGDVDISSSVADYAPNDFPLTSVMKLPFLGESGEKATIVLWECLQKISARRIPKL